MIQKFHPLSNILSYLQVFCILYYITYSVRPTSILFNAFQIIMKIIETLRKCDYRTKNPKSMAYELEPIT